MGSRPRWAVLTGCRKGLVPAALATGGPAAVATELDRLIALFGAGNVFTELTNHRLPDDDDRNDALAALAGRAGIPVLATNNVHYARPADFRLATALAAIRARRSLDEIEGWLPAAGTAHLCSGTEMADRLGRFPGVLDRAADLGKECAFDFTTTTPRLPDFPVPAGYTEASWLRHLVDEGALARYGPPGTNPKAHQVLARELDIITRLGYPGYFLTVHDIVRFCRDNNILVQGRGSAANSAVCYALGITSVDAVRHNLLFERFLSPHREGPPDIDLDIESGRREQAIQYVYEQYGRDRAAQVANVISYRPKMAVRDAARALGYSPGAADAWSARTGPYEPVPGPAPTGGDPPRDGRGTARQSSSDSSAEPDDPRRIPADVADLARQLQKLPRHLGIHSGGMVICDRPVGEVVPVEHARMPGRTVVQWDKDDCADQQIIKIDLLGLGMLGALHDTFDLIRDRHGVDLGLDRIPEEDPDVYRMIQDADTVGVFQIESRAQMSMLPRLRPARFYDLVVQVAIIRPGPIQGGAIHPYLRRRNGQEDPEPPHPNLAAALRRTHGVPLFQEQVMQVAIDGAGFTPEQADRLRRAMSSKRFDEKMSELRGQLMTGMAENGITGDVTEDIYRKLLAFSDFGFPESHAVSFARIVYASAYLKRFYPAAFLAGLLRNQPMGFYSPASLVTDARRHGVTVRGVDINASHPRPALEPLTGTGRAGHAPAHPFASPIPQPAVRLGLASVRHVGTGAADRIAAERATGGPYRDLEDLTRRTRPSTAALEALGAAGAFAGFGVSRREALWTAGALATAHPDQLPGSTTSTTAPPLPAMTPVERTLLDLWATGTSPDSHPLQHVRPDLAAAGVTPAAGLRELRDRQLVRVAGLVTHRQRPPTAGGACFLSLEDETGTANIVCPPDVWNRERDTAIDHPALIVHGILERAGGATNVRAGRLRPLPVAAVTRSRDFR